MRVLTILQGNKPVTYSQTVWLEAVDAAQIKENEEITLMYWGNVIVRRIHKTGDVVTSLYAGFPRTLRRAHRVLTLHVRERPRRFVSHFVCSIY